LPEASVDRIIYRPPHHRGFDFHYDTLKNKLRISLRFWRALPGDAIVYRVFGLKPLVVVDRPDQDNNDDDNASDASSENAEDVVDPATIKLVVGDLLGADDHLLEVRRVLSQ
jgi:hypothetical protein